MRAALFVWFVFALLAPGYLESAEKGLELRLSDNLTIITPSGWRLSNQTSDSIEIYVPLLKERGFPKGEKDENPKPPFVISSEAGMLITMEPRRDHAEALRRLAEIASEYPEKVTMLVIAGWPAIERRYRALMPQPGGEASQGNIQTSFATTAVAVGTTVVRFNTMLAPNADLKLLEEALAIGRALRGPEGPPEVSKQELDEIQRMMKQPRDESSQSAPVPSAKPQSSEKREPGVAVQVHTGWGELEVASNDGQHVVVAANSGYSFSDNFGASYTFGGGTPCNQTFCDGDPSLAVGKSGAIYYAWIGGATKDSLNDGISRSIDNGHQFTFRGLAATCPGSTNCTTADQEHVAADRNNAATGGGDRVYNVWRNFAPAFSIRISCSTDGASTWTAGTPIAAGDFPRVSVGNDGFVYVAWASGANIMLHKFSNCDAGLSAQTGWPITVKAFTDVSCPMPGLDRCNGRNILSSPMIAVDDLDPKHIYYVFATSTAAGNEDIMVYDSVDGGATFPRSVRINKSVTAHRFMPWISTYGGIAVVSWYDRRTATWTNNDLTRFYIGGAAVKGAKLGALTETDLSGVDDTQCSIWPCATDAMTDSESCSVQPQLAGQCCAPPTPTNSCPGSHIRCDFSQAVPADAICPSGETCSIGRGCPKYGDYNGNAVGAGRMYSAWASSVPPTAVGGAGGTIRVYSSADRIPSDFYVRDWNDTPTSFDNGAQPSTHANFWSTSDVWNQSTNVAALPSPGGFVVGDPPSRSGSNFAYGRVSRRAPAMSTAPNATVTVNFLRGDFGLGASFVSIGSENVTFTANEMTKTTPAHSWSVPTNSSLHLCLAVEINGPDGDTFQIPSVAGTAPGPADPMILNDNNKAQRNLADTIGTAAGTELIAVIRNSEKEGRVMRLRMAVPPGIRLPGIIDVIGGRSFEIANNTQLDLGQLAPGEARWLRFRSTNLTGIDKQTPIDVFEDTNPPANGFTILLKRDSPEKVAKRNLIDFASVLTRLAELEDNPIAKEQAKRAIRASDHPSKATYASYLSRNRAAIRKIIARHLRDLREKDNFEIGAATEEMWQVLDQKKIDRTAASHRALIERIDAHLSSLLRNIGKE